MFQPIKQMIIYTEKDGDNKFNESKNQLEDNIPDGDGEGDDSSQDSLPEEYQYLCTLNYNQPRQPRCGDILSSKTTVLRSVPFFHSGIVACSLLCLYLLK